MELHRKTFEKGFASIGYMEIVWRQISASISSIHGFRGYGVLKLAELSGHIKVLGAVSKIVTFVNWLNWTTSYPWDCCCQAIYGIALPSGSEKLYTASECHSGHYDGVVNLGREIGSSISADPWLLAGIKIVVKVSFKHNLLKLFVHFSLIIIWSYPGTV